jgi:hypothetical protein
MSLTSPPAGTWSVDAETSSASSASSCDAQAAEMTATDRTIRDRRRELIIDLPG